MTSEARLWLEIYKALWAVVGSLRRRDETEKARAVYLGALMSVARAIGQSGRIPAEHVAHEHRPQPPMSG